jgi:hypothetical protein
MFRYLGKAFRNQNCLHIIILWVLKQIKFRECMLSEPSVFPFAIHKHRDKIYRQRILPVILYGCETWSLTLREE